MDIHTQLRTRGRAPKAVEAEIVRELVADDLALLGEEKGSAAPPLKRISERHHALARCLAGGMKEAEAVVVCGYTLSRISILKADPAFRELLSFYADNVDKQYIGLHERLSSLAQDAAAIMQDRLEEVGDQVSMAQLSDIIKLGADRTGHGPQSQATTLNINVDMAGRLEAARKRANAPRLIEG